MLPTPKDDSHTPKSCPPSNSAWTVPLLLLLLSPCSSAVEKKRRPRWHTSLASCGWGWSCAPMWSCALGAVGRRSCEPAAQGSCVCLAHGSVPRLRISLGSVSAQCSAFSTLGAFCREPVSDIDNLGELSSGMHAAITSCNAVATAAQSSRASHSWMHSAHR